AGLGVLLPLRAGAAAVDLGDGTGRRGAGAVWCGDAPGGPHAHLGIATGLQDGPVADPLGPGGPMDPAVRLQQRHGPERPASDDRLAAGLRRADGRPGRNQPGRPVASRGRRDAAAVRYRLLVAVLARRG